jgi:hypothetical protein
MVSYSPRDAKHQPASATCWLGLFTAPAFAGKALAYFLPLIAVAHRSISDGDKEISSRQFGLWSNTSIAC